MNNFMKKCKNFELCGNYTTKFCRTGLCRKCYQKAWNPEKRKANAKAWKKANPDKIKAWEKVHYEANTEKILADAKAQRKANPEKAKAISKKWRDANIERARASTKTWVEANPERVKANTKAWAEANPERKKDSNKTRYEANNEWLWNLIYDMLGTDCVVCGKCLANQDKTKRDLHHFVSSEKLFSVVNSWKEHTLEEILEEIPKCVLCCGGYRIEGRPGSFGWGKSCHLKTFHKKGGDYN